MAETAPAPALAAVSPMFMEDREAKNQNGGTLLRSWDNPLGGAVASGFQEEKKVASLNTPSPAVKDAILAKKEEEKKHENQDLQLHQPLPVAQVLGRLSSFIEPFMFAGLGVPVEASAAPTTTTTTTAASATTQDLPQEAEGQFEFVGTATTPATFKGVVKRRGLTPSLSSPCLFAEDDAPPPHLLQKNKEGIHNNNNNNNHRRRIFKKHKKIKEAASVAPDPLSNLPPPPSLTTAEPDIHTCEEAEYVVVGTELIATECSYEADEELRDCIAEHMMNSRSCGTVAQSGMRKSLVRFGKWMKNRRQREKIRRQQQQQQHDYHPEEEVEESSGRSTQSYMSTTSACVNLSERSAQSYVSTSSTCSATSTSSSSCSKKNRRRIFRSKRRKDSLPPPPTQPAQPPMVTAQLLGYTTTAAAASIAPFLPPTANIDASFFEAVQQAALADEMAGEGDVVRIQNITREDEFIPEEEEEAEEGGAQLQMQKEVNACLEKTNSCESLVDIDLNENEDDLVQRITQALEEEDDEDEDDVTHHPQDEEIVPQVLSIVEEQSIIQEAEQLIQETQALSIPEATPEPEVEEEEDDDEEELPIIEEVERVYNDTVKLMFMGSSKSGKSTVASSLLSSPLPKNKKSVVVSTWTPPPSAQQDDDKVQFSVWDLPGNNSNHPLKDAHSLYFSTNSLYVLTWDGGVFEPQSFLPRRNTCCFEEGEEEDVHTKETVQLKSNRVVERDVDTNVLPYIQSLISLQKSEGAVIVPVLTHSDLCSDDTDVERRCRILKRRLEYFMRFKEEEVGEERLPKVVYGEGGDVIRLGVASADNSAEYGNDGVDKLRETIRRITSSCSPSITGPATPFESHLGKHVPRLTITIQQVLNKLSTNEQCKIISLPLLIQKIQKYDEEEDEELGGVIDRAHVVESLKFLSSIGKVLYFSQQGDDSILNEFVVLCPRWLMGAISCVLSHDLRRKLAEARELVHSQRLPYQHQHPFHQGGVPKATDQSLYRSSVPCTAEEKKMEEDNCLATSAPWNIFSSCGAAITSNDLFVIWQSMNFMREAVEKAYSSSAAEDYGDHCEAVFSYLNSLLVHHGVFVPVNTSTNAKDQEEPSQFLIPSLLTESVPHNIWSYKTSDAWRTTLSQSWLFRDVALLPSLMPQIMASVLKDVSDRSLPYFSSSNKADGILQVHHFHCWKSAFLLVLGMISTEAATGEPTLSKVEIFVHLGSADSKHCVASDVMTDTMRRLVVSAKGQVGCGGRKIWEGGYDLVLRSVERVINKHTSRQQQGDHCCGVQREIACPTCLAVHHHSDAALLKLNDVLSASKRKDGEHMVRCRHGHESDSNALCGSPRSRAEKSLPLSSLVSHENAAFPTKAVEDLKGGVVLVGLWDNKKKRIESVGSGFIADKKQGLVITASHVLMKIESGHAKFGRNYFGLEHGKAVIGVIPRSSSGGQRSNKAIFRYFAEIVAKDVEHMDACVLRITTRMEEDVGGQGEGCGDQPETTLVNDPKAIRAQRLQHLHMTRKFAIEEGVRIIGYNQGGEGLVEQGSFVHRTLDVVKGYVSEEFENDFIIKRRQIEKEGERLEEEKMMTPASWLREPVPVGSFNPTKEIVVRCPTINGHSGGPCVNHDGKVIGILSRADPTERERCYLVPTSELKVLLEEARVACDQNPMEKVMGKMLM